MNIELIKSEIKDALHTSFLLGSVKTGIKSGPDGVNAHVALEMLNISIERKVMGIVEDMYHSCKSDETQPDDEELD